MSTAGRPVRLSEAAVAIKNPGSNLLTVRIPADNLPAIRLALLSASEFEGAHQEIFISSPFNLGFDRLVRVFVLPVSDQPFKRLQLRIGTRSLRRRLRQLADLPT